MDVKTGELPAWMLMRDFAPEALLERFTFYCRYLQACPCEERAGQWGFYGAGSLCGFSTAALLRNSDRT